MFISASPHSGHTLHSNTQHFVTSCFLNEKLNMHESSKTGFKPSLLILPTLT